MNRFDFPFRRMRPRRQSGAVLIVALLFLMIITMLGITSMQSTSSEERMAGNSRDSNNALQAAEAALRDAWYDIINACAPGLVGCTPRAPVISGSTGFGLNSVAGTCTTAGLCAPSGTFPNYTFLNITNWSNTGGGAVFPVTYGTYTLPGGPGAPAPQMPNVAKQPQYVIEALCAPDAFSSLGGVGCPNYHYRITARGFGGNSNTQVTLQSTVRL